MIQKSKEVTLSRPTKCSLHCDEEKPIPKIIKIEAMKVFPGKQFFG